MSTQRETREAQDKPREGAEEERGAGYELVVPFLHMQDWAEHDHEVTLIEVDGGDEDDYDHLMTEWVSATMEDVVHLEEMR